MVRKKFQGVGFVALMLVVVALGCTKKSLEPSLKQNLEEDALSAVVELQAALDGAYDFMSDYHYYGRDYIIYNEVRSDNCLSTGNSNRFSNFWNRLLSTDRYASDTWLAMYKVIGQCNYVISKADVSLEGPAELQSSIVGQAYALRALVHFDLLKLYGGVHVNGQQEKGVPYVTKWSKEESTPARTDVEAFRQQLYADLDQAVERIPSDAPIDRAYVGYYAAHALKARVAQWFGDWSTAEQEAKVVIESKKFSILNADEFLQSWEKKFNKNSLFEISNNASDNQSIDGIANIYGGDAYGDVVPTPELVELLQKDPNDVRSKLVGENEALKKETKGEIGYYWANMVKYPDLTSYSDNIPLIRIEEVVLIYAEALMHNGNSAEALNQLNSIATKRNAAPYTEATEETIMLERRKELCFEGFRFDDLSRAHLGVLPSKATALDLLKRSYEYGSVDYSFPIPKGELNANPSLHQNLGY